MPENAGDRSRESKADVSRRDFLNKSGVVLAAGGVLPSFSAFASPDGHGRDDAWSDRVPEGRPRRSWKRPNLLILITDQERYPQHWPEGWADANLPNRKRLADHGLTFTRAFCASSMCTPSRATLFTGLYPSEHKVEQTLRYGSGPSAIAQSTLQPDMKNIATMLATAGYDVHYRGKWHISKDPSGTLEVRSPDDLERYGFWGWVPPDGGTDQNPSCFGGGTTNYDSMYAAQAVDFLNEAKPHSSRPFALVVCLINPHDIMSYPTGWNSKSGSDIPPFKDSCNYADVDLNAPPLDQIDLPANFRQEEFKPAAQTQSTEFWTSVLGDFKDDDKRREYLRFYAHLHLESDRQIGAILDALESQPSLYHNTLVIRLADHGEMGLSHGGMRQKAYNAYEETINVPFVVSNPKLFPGPVQTSALASLVDLMPTLATIAEVPNRQELKLVGCDLTPVIQDAIDNPSHARAIAQDSILFTTDENLGSLKLGSDGTPMVKEPSHIRCLREDRWKIVMYFDPAPADGTPSVYELYDLERDPLEQNNMADPANDGYYNPEKLSEMIVKLQNKMRQTHTTPK